MSSKKASGGKNVLAIVRYVVDYVERYIKNAVSQIKWTWKQSKRAHNEYVRLHTNYIGTPPQSWMKIFAGFFIAIAGVIVLKILLILMLFKSI